MATDRALRLALDQGGSTSRALVFDAQGRVVARAAVEVATARPADDRVEQDAEELVRSLRRALREAVGQLGRRAADLVCAGLATQRSSVVAWDRAGGAALAPCLSWQDRRAAARIAALAEHASRVRALTGLRLSPHYGASKLAWLFDHEPRVRAACADGALALGPLASFLVHRLCEERPLVVDAANAARTLLLDVHACAWSSELLDLFGVPATVLPRVVGTRAGFGSLDVGARRIPLAVVTGDQSAAFLAAGEPDPDVASITFGTGAFVLRAVRGDLPDAPNLLATLVGREGEASTFALEGTINGAGSALAAVAREIGPAADEVDLVAELARNDDLPLFLNGVGGLAAPWWRADFGSRFADGVDGAGSEDRAAGGRAAGPRLAAVVESVVFLAAEVLAEMERVLGRPRVVRAGGGLAQLDGLCTRLAALTDLRVERHAEHETTALGLARLLGATPGAPRYESFEPRPDAALRDRHARWRAALHAALD
jgi:glycerol kinase